MLTYSKTLLTPFPQGLAIVLGGGALLVVQGLHSFATVSHHVAFETSRVLGIEHDLFDAKMVLNALHGSHCTVVQIAL